MDEKGFFIGVTTKTKRVFTKRVWASKERTAAIQDGNKEWVTLLACVCASGESLPPSLIYQGTSGLQSSWVDDVEAEENPVFLSNSPTGWKKNELGLAWLQQVFDRYTKAKARSKWRLLLLDGHGSHLTRDFIDFCDHNRILIALFPPIQPTASSRSISCCSRRSRRAILRNSTTTSSDRKAGQESLNATSLATFGRRGALQRGRIS
jgi:hypothetical protein